jgi:hypothetical protein
MSEHRAPTMEELDAASAAAEERERVHKVNGHATEPPPPESEVQGDEWMGLCSKTDKGTVIASDANNVALALRHSAVWRGVVAHDVFSRCPRRADSPTSM